MGGGGPKCLCQIFKMAMSPFHCTMPMLHVKFKKLVSMVHVAILFSSLLCH